MDTLQHPMQAQDPGNPRTIKVFICYRRDDASFAAGVLHTLLDKYSFADRHGALCQLDVYFDQAEPGVENWKSHHQPSLESARAFIVLCSHGLATDFSKEGSIDWAHREIGWWMDNRGAAPILIDLTEHERWIPERIRKRWPDLNRILVNPQDLRRSAPDSSNEYEARLRQRVVKTIVESEHATSFEEVTRNRKRIAQLNVISVLAAIACVAASIGWWRAYQAQQVAESQKEVSRSSVSFVSQLFSRADPDDLLGESSMAKQLLKTAPSTIAGESSLMFKAHLLRIVGGVYTGLANSDEAIAVLTNADQIVKDENGQAEDQFRMAYSLGEAYLYAKDIEPARGHLERAQSLAKSDGVSKSERAYVKVLLGDYFAWSEKHSDPEISERHYQDALALDQTSPANRIAVARDFNRLGNLANSFQKSADARKYFQSAVDVAKGFPEGTNPLFLGQYEHDLAAALYEDGSFDEALKRFSTYSDVFRDAYGNDSIEYGTAENNVGRMLLELDRLDEASTRIARAVDVQAAARGPTFAGLALARNTLALTLRLSGNSTASVKELETALRIAQASGSPIAAQILVHLAENDLLRGDNVAARKNLDEANKAFLRSEITTGWRYALYENAMGEMLVRECKLEDAQELLPRSEEALGRRWPKGNLFTRIAASRQQILAERLKSGAPCTIPK